MATGWHFKESRGILIPVTRKVNKDPAWKVDVTIGEVQVDDTVKAVLEGIELLNKPEINTLLDNAENYAKQYTWASIANRISDLLVF